MKYNKKINMIREAETPSDLYRNCSKLINVHTNMQILLVLLMMFTYLLLFTKNFIM